MLLAGLAGLPACLPACLLPCLFSCFLGFRVRVGCIACLPECRGKMSPLDLKIVPRENGSLVESVSKTSQRAWNLRHRKKEAAEKHLRNPEPSRGAVALKLIEQWPCRLWHPSAHA